MQGERFGVGGGVVDLMRLTWPEVSRVVEVPFWYLTKCLGFFKIPKNLTGCSGSAPAAGKACVGQGGVLPCTRQHSPSRPPCITDVASRLICPTVGP